jgi:DNA sulfur modification protein DndE
MFKQIKTSGANRQVVTDLTRKLGLGAENIVARLAIAYSLGRRRLFSPSEVLDSTGKEYSANILFGNNSIIYLAMLCTLYGINENDKNIPRLFKAHLDDGLQLMDKELKNNPNISGFDYLIDKINEGLI